MSKLSKIALLAVAIFGITSSANAATAILATNDFVGISFWIVSMGCLAATAFFFFRKRISCASVESFNNSSWTSYWYRIHSLHVHERYLDRNW